MKNKKCQIRDIPHGKLRQRLINAVKRYQKRRDAGNYSSQAKITGLGHVAIEKPNLFNSPPGTSAKYIVIAPEKGATYIVEQNYLERLTYSPFTDLRKKPEYNVYRWR